MRPLVLLGALAVLVAAGPTGLTIAGEAFQRADILDARTVPDGRGSAAILLTFTPKGAAHLKALTAARAGTPLPILLDGAKIAEPTFSGGVDDGQLQISGDFGDFAAAAAVAKRISGKDPVPEALGE